MHEDRISARSAEESINHCLMIASAQDCLALPIFTPYCRGHDNRNQLRGGNVLLLLMFVFPL
jgi:hypothetical protein